MSYGPGIIRGNIVIDGCLEPVQIKNVHHVPDIPHILISPLQLEDNSLDLQWCHGYGIEFYQDTHLHLYMIGDNLVDVGKQVVGKASDVVTTVYSDAKGLASKPFEVLSNPFTMIAVGIAGIAGIMIITKV